MDSICTGRISVEEFCRLGEAEAFLDRHVELIDGEMFDLSPITIPHGAALASLMFEVGAALRVASTGLTGYGPVSTLIDDYNLPLPDLTIAMDSDDMLVNPREVRLVVEVAVGTLDRDLGLKAALYANAGMPEYWIVDVDARQIVRFHRPLGGEYRQRAVSNSGDAIPTVACEGLVIRTTELLRRFD